LDEVGHRDVAAGARVGPDGVRQVADAHVVARDGEVDAPELALRLDEVLDRAADGLLGHEAVVDAPALGQQPLDLAAVAPAARRGDVARQLAALLQVDAHLQEVGGRRGHDLREPARRLRVLVAAGDDVGPSAALQEHDRLQQVGGDLRPPHRLLDLPAVGHHPLRRRLHPARAAGVDDVRQPVRRPRLEVGDLRGVVRLALRRILLAQLGDCCDAGDGHGDQEQDGERNPALPARTFGERPAGHRVDRMRS
jgi:hypothetical protein